MDAALYILATVGLFAMVYGVTVHAADCLSRPTRLGLRFALRRPLPRDARALERELEAVWERSMARAVPEDVLRLYRRAAECVRMERLGAPQVMRLHELRLLSEQVGRVVARVADEAQREVLETEVTAERRRASIRALRLHADSPEELAEDLAGVLA